MPSGVESKFRDIVLKYNQLPCIAIKKWKNHYIIPHRPRNSKFLQNYSENCKLTQQISASYNKFKLPGLSKSSGESDPILQTNQNQNNLGVQKNTLKLKQFSRELKEYKYKYKAPLKIMSLTGFIVFKKHIYQKIRKFRKISQKSFQGNTQAEKQRQSESKTFFNEEWKVLKQSLQILKTQSNLSSVEKLNKIQSPSWRKMSQDQKEFYEDIAYQIKLSNQKRIQQYIVNHQVPTVKRYRSMGQYIKNVASYRSINLSAKQIYINWANLSQQQKQNYKVLAKVNSDDSVEKYKSFLKKWNLNSEQLQHIYQICELYQEFRSIKNNHKKQKSQPDQLYDDNDDDDGDNSQQDFHMSLIT